MNVEPSVVEGKTAAITISGNSYEHLTAAEVVALRAALAPFEVEPKKTVWTVEYCHEDGWGPSTTMPAAYASRADAEQAIQQPWRYRAVLDEGDGSYRVEFFSTEHHAWKTSAHHHTTGRSSYSFEEASAAIAANPSALQYRIVPA